MKVAGLVTEYNPFHLGHLVHLDKARALTGATHVIAVMSGSFVQRGEPALVDKWTRAEMAVKNGVDLVVELPFVYSVQTAELFAAGAIRILDSTESVDYLVFGSESGKIQELCDIADILANEPPGFKDLLRYYLDKGNSFSVSRSLALSDYSEIQNLNIANIHSILKESNNILGIEYLKALIRNNSKMSPVTFKRTGDDYKEQAIKSKIASATGIRNKLKTEGVESVRDLLPEESYYAIVRFIERYGLINQLYNYKDIINYKLCILSPEKISRYSDVEIGLENRIKNISSEISNPEELVSAVSTKRYTETRIRRLLIHLIAEVEKEFIGDFYSSKTSYVRILASNKKGFEIINKIKKESQVKLINKLTDSMESLDSMERKMLQLDILATDLYFLGLGGDKPTFGMDYKNSPSICT